MNILITGIAGFIGYHVAQRLLADGHQVYGIDNLVDNGDLSIKLQRLAQLGIGGDALDAVDHPLASGHLRFLRLDIKDREVLVELCRYGNFELVLHLAAATGIGNSRVNPAHFFDTNVGGTANVLEAARLSGVKHVFYSSSAVVHGAHSHAPQAEEDDVDMPINIYAGTKRAAEILCYTYARTYELPVTVFRFFTAYGPWGRPDSVPMKLARDILEGHPIRVINDGYLVRDFTYIDDIMDGVMSIIDCPPYDRFGAPYDLFNIRRGKPVALLEFIQALETSLGRSAHVQLEPTDPHSLGLVVEDYADTAKIERLRAYSPVWDIDVAVPPFIEWFLEHYGRSFTM